MSKTKFPQAYNDFEKSNGSDTAVYNTEPSLTRQEFAEECDINTLMKRYDGHVLGGPGNLSPREPRYVDFSEAPDTLLGYMEMMKRSEDAFMTLPAGIRREFDNDAIAFCDFAADPLNLDQMREWGLAPPAKVPDAPVEVSSPSPAPTPPSAATAPGGASTHGST